MLCDVTGSVLMTAAYPSHLTHPILDTFPIDALLLAKGWACDGRVSNQILSWEFKSWAEEFIPAATL